MGNLGLPELAVIFLVALFVVGPKRLPEIARAFGEAFRAFQEALKEQPPDERGVRHRDDSIPPS